MMAIEIVNYLKNPVLNGNNTAIKEKVRDVFTTFIIYLLFALVSYLILTLIDKFIIEYFYNYSVLKQLKLHSQKINDLYGSYTFLVVVMLGPFLEEIIFRLPLKLEKLGIGLSIALLTYRYSGGHFLNFDLYNFNSYIRVAVTICLVVTTTILFPNGWIKIIKERHFKYFFYTSAFAFALIHITNLAPYKNQLFLFYPLFTLPQLIMGLAIGYIRMKHGFISGWGLHALINLPSVLFS
jgi:Type II CAAX prenyl endopeptidase Rce1-like